ncbi:MAG: Rnase Y domain-containing protein, partial [Wenyingzhuangia sp.]
MDTTIILIAIGTFVSGFVIAKLLEKFKVSNLTVQAEKDARSIVKEAKITAESIKKDKILQAKEKFIELKAEHEKVIFSRDKKVLDSEKRAKEKEVSLNKEIEKERKLIKTLEEREKDYDHRLEILEKKQETLDKTHKRQIDLLESISGLSAEEAKVQLVDSLKAEAKTDAMGYIRDTLEEAKLTAEQDARKVILNTIQRVGVEQSIENCVSVFNI